MPVPAFLRVLWAALWLALSSGLAVAQAPGARDIETALDKLAADSFGDTEAAIALIARSGVAAGVAILEALGDRRLFFVAGDTAVFYKDAAGRSFNARSGVATDIPASASSVRLNNRLRGQVQAALGSMTLL